MICELCGVAEAYDRHHSVPRSRGGGGSLKLLFCFPCHSMVHSVMCNKDLERRYSTVQLLLSHPEIAKWVEWRKRHPNVIPDVKATRERRRKSRYS